MIDIKALEKDEATAGEESYQKAYRRTLEWRGESPALVDQALKLNSERKRFISEMETLRAEQNKVGEEVARRKRAKEDATDILTEMQALSQKVKDLDQKAQEADQVLTDFMLRLPNKIQDSVPRGTSEADNQEVRKWGEPKVFPFKPKDHVELGEKLGIIDFERAGKVAGARFAFLRRAGSQLERALIQYKMDLHTREHGYEEMIPPFIANSNSFKGTSQFPKFVDDVFHLQGTDYHLIPTAEVPVTNFYADEILDESSLPQFFTAYSPCFRSEAGSYGRDTKGLIRQHQFNKVELVMFCRPEESLELHERLVVHAETVLKQLELPFRRMVLCSKDIGFGAAKCFDLEVWLPGQAAYREISSCSNFEDFQARRANIRYRPQGPKAKPQYVHTLNGSGLAVGRTLIAILENYQQEDGSVLIPKVLQGYMGGLKEIRPPKSNA